MTGWAGARYGGAAASTLLLAVLILVFSPISFAYNGVVANVRPSAKNDFTSYYVAGLAVRQGMPEALYYPEPAGSLLAQASTQHPWIDLARSAGIDNPNYYLYPPLFAVVFAPLTLLSYESAYVAWILISALCLAVSLWMLLAAFEGTPRRVLSSPRSLMTAAALVLIAGLFYPVTRSLAVGQSSLTLLAILTAAFVLLRRGTRSGDAWGGFWLACGIMLKLTPVVFLLWLALRRRWRALIWTGAGLTMLLVVSMISVGVGPHVVYARHMVGLLSGGTAFYPNQSISGFLARAAGGDMRLADLVDPFSSLVTVARLAAAGLIAGTLWIIRRRRLDDDRAFSLLALTTLAISPISWEHHYVLALIPAWVLIQDAVRSRSISVTRAAAAGGALALAGSYIGLRVIEATGTGWISQVTASACLLGGMILWWLLASGRPEPWAVETATERLAAASPVAAPAALLAMICLFAGGNFLFKLIEYNRAYRYGDFTSYYVAAATLVEGSRPLYYPRTPDMILARAETPSAWTETATRWGVREANYYLYPPFFAMAIVPLTLLAYGAAHTVWYSANLAALAGCVWLLVATARKAGGAVRSHDVALTTVAIALSWPSLFTFGAGQANFVVLLLLLGALAALRSRRDVQAGLMVAGAAAIKMTPALLLVYLAWRRRWAALGAAAVALAALVLAGAAAAGWESYTVYLEEMVPLLSRGCAHWINESMAGFFARLVDGGDMFAWSLSRPSVLSRMLTTTASLLLVAGAFLLAGRREASLDLEFSLLVVTTLFVSPLSWTHHSVLSLMAFLLVGRHLVERSEMTVRMAGALAVSFALIHVYVKPPGLFEHGPLRVLASYNLIGNLMLWGIIAGLLRRQRAHAEPAPGFAAAG